GEIYKKLLEEFDCSNLEGFHYKEGNESIKLNLSSPQPEIQKNGFHIYRLNGFYENEGRRIPFELQIKSLVNIFWGEIEHKIVYKNNNYMLMDSFIKDIMISVKKNLTMIDHQLLVIYNQFKTQDGVETEMKELQFEKLLSKIIYDEYALKMKKSIGFVVDFKKPCETIIKYILRKDKSDIEGKMIKILQSINEIHKIDTEFNEEIIFEREITFKNEFSKRIGEKLLDSINTEFQWSLFFRIIFEIEPLNNAEDFENFIEFYSEMFRGNKSFLKLERVYNEDLEVEIKNEILGVLSTAFVNCDTIEFVIEKTIVSINYLIDKCINYLCETIKNEDEWREKKEQILNHFCDEINKLLK
ncbi:MAG: (p)ppGpp synthetase, partial [Clostridium sp.]